MKVTFPTPVELQEAAEQHAKPLVGRGGSIKSEKAQAIISDWLSGADYVLGALMAQLTVVNPENQPEDGKEE